MIEDSVLAHTSKNPDLFVTPIRYIIHNTAKQISYHTTEGLAFTIGVAVLECGLVADSSNIYEIQHPNSVVIYLVTYVKDTRQVLVTKVGA